MVSPKAVTLLCNQYAVAKAQANFPRTLLKGFMAGACLAFGCLFSLMVTGAVYKDPLVPQGWLKLITGLTFPVGLIMILLSGLELFTSNVMFMTNGILSRKIGWKPLVISWVSSYFTNFAGGVFGAYFLGYAAQVMDDRQIAFLEAVVVKKVHMSTGVAILRGVGCNWLVCLAVFQSLTTTDTTGKIVSCFLPILVFVGNGYEHSIANLIYFPLAMMFGSEVTAAEWWLNNQLPVTLGNILGGLIFMGSIYFYIYLKEDLDSDSKTINNEENQV